MNVLCSLNPELPFTQENGYESMIPRSPAFSADCSPTLFRNYAGRI